MNRSDLTTAARRHHLDLVGYTTSDRVESRMQQGARPSDISEYLPGFVVVARRIPAGLSGLRDGEPKPMALALVHRSLEEGAAGLAYELEAHDHLAVVVPPLAMDFDRVTESALTPAGQGAPLIRAAAVEAGIGKLGLNNMVLTPQYGPRVLLSALMTSLELEPDPPLTDELCPGLAGCGRCAAVCPAGAIPAEAPLETALTELRGLDESACAERCQPFGVRKFASHVRQMVQEPEEVEALTEGPATALLWYHVAFLRQGAFSGCTRCLQVCPVGQDWEMVGTSPFRSGDLPDDFAPRVEGQKVRVDPIKQREHH